MLKSGGTRGAGLQWEQLLGFIGSVQHHCDTEQEREREWEREPQPRGDKFIGIGTMLETAAEILWSC